MMTVFFGTFLNGNTLIIGCCNAISPKKPLSNAQTVVERILPVTDTALATPETKARKP